MKRRRLDSKENEASVDAYLSQLDHPLNAVIAAVRRVILDTNNRIRETIKWNAPSFYISEHFATFHLQKSDYLLVIFHRGAKPTIGDDKVKIDDPQGILEWLSPDRCAVRFHDLDDVEAKKATFTDIINQWIAAMDDRSNQK